MILLKEKQICPHAGNCQYNTEGTCQGANPTRTNEFSCAYVVDGQIREGQPIRLTADKTGHMKIIME